MRRGWPLLTTGLTRAVDGGGQPGELAGVIAARLRQQGSRAAAVLRDACAAGADWLEVAVGLAADCFAAAWSSRVLRIALPALALAVLGPPLALAHHLYFDRSGLPDLDDFLRFEDSTTGGVYDAQGAVLIELAHEYRRVVRYDEVPPILRQAILAAEDKNFFSHSGIEYGALPRVLQKTAVGSLAAWWRGAPGIPVRFPQGGSTLTQQLVRGYFLQNLTSRENGEALCRGGMTPRLLSVFIGVPATNKLVRKLEEVRLALWLEKEMIRRYGSRERAKREIFARYASFIYLGNGRYGFASAAEYYFGKPLSSYTQDDAGEAALLAGIAKAPGQYAPKAGSPRVLRRRNQILALMVRNGSIPESVATRCQTEPVRVAVAPEPVKTQAPAAIEAVFGELKRHGGDHFGGEDLLRGRIAVRSTVDARIQILVNQALEDGLAAYEKRHPEAKVLIQGSVVVLRNEDAAIWPSRVVGRSTRTAMRTTPTTTASPTRCDSRAPR